MNSENLNSFILANPEKCVGCRTCEVACALAHMGQHPAVAGEVSARLTPRVFVVNLDQESAPIMRRHCEDSPCANVCTMGAFSRQDGRVMVDSERCVGSRLRLMACPFGAVEFAPLRLETGSVLSATRPAGDEKQKILYRANKTDADGRRNPLLEGEHCWRRIHGCIHLGDEECSSDSGGCEKSNSVLRVKHLVRKIAHCTRREERLC